MNNQSDLKFINTALGRLPEWRKEVVEKLYIERVELIKKPKDLNSVAMPEYQEWRRAKKELREAIESEVYEASIALQKRLEQQRDNLKGKMKGGE